MKVVFLSPPQQDKQSPSLGIAYIAELLRANGHQSFLHDGANATMKEMMKFVDKISPNVVGITMNTTNRFDALKLARAIKIKYRIPIILGGPHPTLMTDQLLKNYKYIDFIVRNEGEYTTLNLINCLEKKEDYSKLNGISFRQGDKIIHNPQVPFIKDLDELPIPDWSQYDLKKYKKSFDTPYNNYPHGTIISSRGCPFKCSFCSTNNFWGYHYRLRSPENVLKEMKMLYNLGIRFIFFSDDNFASNKKRAIQICKLIIKEGLNEKMSWQCRAEVNIIDDELLEWMKKANCHLIEFGIEDCTDEGLRWFKKGHKSSQVKKAFDLCKKHGIQILSYFIIGGDHETKKNINEKKKYIEELNPDISTASILVAYPKTDIYELGKNKGLWDDSIWLKDLVGEKYLSNAPIYTGPNLNYAQVSAASAEILFWWNNKKGHKTFFKNNFKIAFDLMKKGDIKKFITMGFAVVKQRLADYN